MKYGLLCRGVLLPGPAAVFPAGNGDQLVWNLSFVQGFVQAHRLRVRHQLIQVTMDGNDRRQISANVHNGRQPLRKTHPIRQAAEPHHCPGLLIRALEYISDVGDPKEIDDRPLLSEVLFRDTHCRSRHSDRAFPS